MIEMKYDYMGRRVESVKRDYNTKAVLSHQKFVYDGYTLIQELDENNFMEKDFVWDPTAGAATRPLVYRKNIQNLYYIHDANKNVRELIAGDLRLIKRYDYNPFGEQEEIVSGSGYEEMANGNPFGFSSEYHDKDLRLIYYNYRHYNPHDGRWLSRDPIEERGGYNLYGFVKNNPFRFFDFLGHSIAPFPPGVIGIPNPPSVIDIPSTDNPRITQEGSLLIGGFLAEEMIVHLDFSSKSDLSDPCCIPVKILIETVGTGHVAVIIGENFYDYGPPGGAMFWEVFLGANGGFMNSSYHRGRGPEYMLDDFSKKNGVEMTIMVCKENADKMRAAWSSAFRNYKTYTWFWRQCTSVACETLEAGGIKTPFASSLAPEALYLSLSLQTSIAHQCGENKGAFPQLKLIEPLK